MKIISEDACFGGVQGVCSHKSATCNCDMRSGLFLPKQAKTAKVPVLWYLSGLTCTRENAMVARRQPGAFRMQTGYNHSYFFVASFMRDHVDFHAEALGL